jgi:hypothetical protein
LSGTAGFAARTAYSRHIGALLGVGLGLEQDPMIFLASGTKAMAATDGIDFGVTGLTKVPEVHIN